MEIIEKIYGNVKDIHELDHYHIETIMLSNDKLGKAIQRVITDHGNEYGIRIPKGDLPLHNGDILKKDGHNLIVIHAKSQEMIIITPKDINQMGTIAHLLGNTHKPVKIQNGQIILERDPVVEKILDHNCINYELKEITLNEPLKHVDLSYDE